jgi:6-phosphogluconolactonase (cycloisomerase 2 family)
MYLINQSTGALTLITTAIASGTGPQSICADPTGRFVYVVNYGASTVSMYSINQNTGALTTITTAIGSGTNPFSICADPTGRFVYVVNYGANTVSMYSINQNTGALTSITTAIGSGTNPISVCVDPTGRWAYATNYIDYTVSMFSIDYTSLARLDAPQTFLAQQTFTNINLDKTIIAAGTTGAQTINKPTGSVNFAAADASLVVTNSLVSATSIIQVSVGTNDVTMKSAQAVAAAGSFTIYPSANPTAETRVNFTITN